MTSLFKSTITGSIGATTSTVFVASTATSTTLVGLSLANITGSLISASVMLTKGVQTVYLVKSAPVPTGASLVMFGTEEKLIIEPGDAIRVVSSTSTSIDAVLSYIEIV